MAKKETSPAAKKIEREYVIPLKSQVRKVPRYKKANKAITTIKEFLAKHMKVPERDLTKIKLDLQVNEVVWQRGIKKPLPKIKVKAVKEDDGTIRVSAVDLPDKIKYRHERINKRETTAKDALESKKTMMQKAKEGLKSSAKEDPNQPGEDQDNDGVDDKVEEKEKQKSEEKANKDLEKQMAKQAKHSTEPKTGKEKAANIKSQDRTSRGH